MSGVIPGEAPAPYALKTGILSSHGRILQFLERGPRDRRILDVGAATGYLGSELQRLGFRHVNGVEVNADWAARAKPFYETIAVCDLENAAFPWEEGWFDVVICADVLEHLRDPASSLKKLSRLVSPTGCLLISLPNVAHWSMRLNLLIGRFEYTASGFLDHSHVRFFTRATARRLLGEAGFLIDREEVIPLPIAHWCKDSAWVALWRAIERADWLLARLRPPLFAYQFLFFARPR